VGGGRQILSRRPLKEGAKHKCFNYKLLFAALLQTLIQSFGTVHDPFVCL